jgi:glycerol-3-phosphate O-acyltransferase
VTGLQVGDGASLIVLVDASSDTERRLVEAALAEQVSGRPATVLPLRGAELAGPLEAAAPDTVVTAVRVAWTPRHPVGHEDAGTRRGRWSAAMPALTRRPPGPMQRMALHRDPDRAQVVLAAPATVTELTGRWEGTGSLADFVA